MYELEDTYWWFVARRELALSVLRRAKLADATLLDVGCGTGAGQSAFSEFGTVFGVDFSQEALEFSGSRGLTLLAKANAEVLPVQAVSVDAVVTLDTIEHVPDDAAALKEIARALKPGGLLLMNVPAYMFLWSPHDVALMHQRRYTVSSARRVVADAGLEIERASYHVFLLFPLVLMLRLLGRIRGGEPSATLPSVPGWASSLLKALMRFELSLFQKVSLPWGSSVVIVARKPR
jgi:SAM-dependent methyltransferase